ncbi:MAG TPA: ImmA/IrrE family metallo-endopeptidase [Verrucomicrobiae bacterium]|nr:ImmA/IrrE family metallo-endopeptidase [Verrucomicrobiae bacterium]
MNAALEAARAYGVAVIFADLGDWGASELRSEYDPHGPVIRINDRLRMREELVARCIYHELYHHREAIGEVRRQSSRRAREAAADAFARAHALLD